MWRQNSRENGAAVALEATDRPSRYARELQELKRATQAYPDVQTILPLPLPEQLAIGSNRRLQEKLGAAATHAIIVVHPGYFALDARHIYDQKAKLHTKKEARLASPYSRQYPMSDVDAWHRHDITTLTALARGDRGDYNMYLNQLSNVYQKSQADPAVPMIIYTEAKRLYGEAPSLAALVAPDHALHISTVESDPTPTTTVRYQTSEGKVHEDPQELDHIFNWLDLNNIATVHLAGEYGLQKDGGLQGACAGTVATELQSRGFTVHGIEGAIFPAAPPELYDVHKRRLVLPFELAAADAMHIATVAI